jgi:hypothetical protein
VCGFTELLRAASHELPSERMIVIADPKQTRAELSLEDYKLIEYNLGHR